MYDSRKFRCAFQIANPWSQHILKSHPVLSLSHSGTVFFMTSTWIHSSASGNFHSINSLFSPKLSNVLLLGGAFSPAYSVFIKGGGMATFWHLALSQKLVSAGQVPQKEKCYDFIFIVLKPFMILGKKNNKTLKQARRSKTVQLVQLWSSEGLWCQNSTFLSLTFILILVTGIYIFP